MSHWTEICPPAPSEMTALLARTIPARKLMALASGTASPAGETRRSPAVAGPTTARVIATAEAVDGIPQRPATGKTRAPPAARAGPPDGPAGPRAPATRPPVPIQEGVG